MPYFLKSQRKNVVSYPNLPSLANSKIFPFHDDVSLSCHTISGSGIARVRMFDQGLRRTRVRSKPPLCWKTNADLEKGLLCTTRSFLLWTPGKSLLLLPMGA